MIDSNGPMEANKTMPVIHPPVVSARNHFSPLLAIVEAELTNAWDEANLLSRNQLADLLMRVARRTAEECRHAFATGSEKGIAQALALLEDPEYYTTVKQRRKRDLERQAEYEKQQRVERAERDQDPEYRKRHIEDIRRSIDHNKQEGVRLEQYLTRYLDFCKTPPKLKRLPIPASARLPGERR